MIEIDRKLSQLETQHKQSNNNQTLQEIINLKYEYNTILTKQVSDQLSHLCTHYFELGDKPHTLLARQLRGQQNSRAILRSGAGDMLTHPKSINRRFREFYQELYKSKAKGDVDSWLKNVPISKLDEASREALNATVTTNEVTDSIGSFASGKAPRARRFWTGVL